MNASHIHRRASSSSRTIIWFSRCSIRSQGTSPTLSARFSTFSGRPCGNGLLGMVEVRKAEQAQASMLVDKVCGNRLGRVAELFASAGMQVHGHPLQPPSVRPSSCRARWRRSASCLMKMARSSKRGRRSILLRRCGMSCTTPDSMM